MYLNQKVLLLKIASASFNSKIQSCIIDVLIVPWPLTKHYISKHNNMNIGRSISIRGFKPHVQFVGNHLWVIKAKSITNHNDNNLSYIYKIISNQRVKKQYTLLYFIQGQEIQSFFPQTLLRVMIEYSIKISGYYLLILRCPWNMQVYSIHFSRKALRCIQVDRQAPKSSIHCKPCRNAHLDTHK